MKYFNKIALTILMTLFTAPLISFGSMVQTWNSYPEISINVAPDAIMYKADLTYSQFTDECKLEPGKSYSSFSCSSAEQSLKGLDLSKSKEMLSWLKGTVGTSHFAMEKFVFYQNTPGDLQSCEITGYDISSRNAFVINVNKEGCSIS